MFHNPFLILTLELPLRQNLIGLGGRLCAYQSISWFLRILLATYIGHVLVYIKYGKENSHPKGCVMNSISIKYTQISENS